MFKQKQSRNQKSNRSRHFIMKKLRKGEKMRASKVNNNRRKMKNLTKIHMGNMLKRTTSTQMKRSIIQSRTLTNLVIELVLKTSAILKKMFRKTKEKRR